MASPTGLPLYPMFWVLVNNYNTLSGLNVEKQKSSGNWSENKDILVTSKHSLVKVVFRINVPKY